MEKRLTKEQIVMQTRCIHCKREQYAIAVYSISHGKHPCVWCGKMSRKMTEDEYFKLLSDES